MLHASVPVCRHPYPEAEGFSISSFWRMGAGEQSCSGEWAPRPGDTLSRAPVKPVLSAIHQPPFPQWGLFVRHVKVKGPKGERNRNEGEEKRHVGESLTVFSDQKIHAQQPVLLAASPPAVNTRGRLVQAVQHTSGSSL